MSIQVIQPELFVTLSTEEQQLLRGGQGSSDDNSFGNNGFDDNGLGESSFSEDSSEGTSGSSFGNTSFGDRPRFNYLKITFFST